MSKVIWWALASCSLCACGDTRHAIEQMHASIAQARLDAAMQTAERLKAGPDLLERGDVQLFLSTKLVGDAARLIEGFKTPLPNRQDVTVEIKSVAPEFSAGVAGLRLAIQAVKGDLSIDVEGLAMLIPQPLKPARVEVKFSQTKLFGKIPITYPEFTWRKSEPMRMKVMVSHIAPKVSWGPFTSELKGFASEFAQLKINEALTAALPSIEVPLDNVIKIDEGARDREFPIKDGAYTGVVTTPPVVWDATFSLREVVIVPRGIHLMGDLVIPGGGAQ